VTGEHAYGEGDVFAVPLDDRAGYGVGLVARADGCGVVLGYFFGPARLELPALGDLGELTVEAAVAVHWFGDLSLVRGEWPRIGRLPHWRRAAWPVPAFGTYNVLLEQAFRLEYPHETFGDVREVPVTRAEADALPWGALFGAGLVEGMLTELLRTQGA
jgi:hypothetical protein